MSEYTLDDEYVYCARCGGPITESYACLGECDCGEREWEYRPPTPFPSFEEVCLTNE
jgi:hypothetical protein